MTQQKLRCCIFPAGFCSLVLFSELWPHFIAFFKCPAVMDHYITLECTGQIGINISSIDCLIFFREWTLDYHKAIRSWSPVKSCRELDSCYIKIDILKDFDTYYKNKFKVFVKQKRNRIWFPALWVTWREKHNGWANAFLSMMKMMEFLKDGKRELASNGHSSPRGWCWLLELFMETASWRSALSSGDHCHATKGSF